MFDEIFRNLSAHQETPWKKDICGVYININIHKNLKISFFVLRPSQPQVVKEQY